MNLITQRLGIALLLTGLLSACSRPVAYFQKSEREAITRSAASPATPASVVAQSEQPTVATPAATPASQLAQATAALTQVDAYVRNDSKLATNKKIAGRLNRMKQLLATASANHTATPTATASPRKMNLLERMAVKHLDKQVKHRLSPERTHKAMASTGILAVGAIAVIVGLLVLLLGGSSALGVIVLLAGAIVLVVGLLA